MAPLPVSDTLIAIHCHLVQVAQNAEDAAVVDLASAIDGAVEAGIPADLLSRIVREMAQSPQSLAMDRKARRLARVARKFVFATVTVGGGAFSPTHPDATLMAPTFGEAA